MRKGEQLDHDTARASLALFGQQCLKDQRVGSSGKQLIAIDEVE